MGAKDIWEEFVNGPLLRASHTKRTSVAVDPDCTTAAPALRHRVYSSRWSLGKLHSNPHTSDDELVPNTGLNTDRVPPLRTNANTASASVVGNVLASSAGVKGVLAIAQVTTSDLQNVSWYRIVPVTQPVISIYAGTLGSKCGGPPSSFRHTSQLRGRLPFARESLPTRLPSNFHV